MGRCFEKVWLFMYTSTWDCPQREYMGFVEEEIRDYIAENPMPENTHFKDVDEVVRELCQSTGIITLDPETPYEFVSWYQELIDSKCHV